MAQKGLLTLRAELDKQGKTLAAIVKEEIETRTLNFETVGKQIEELRLQSEQLLPHSPHDEPAWERKCARAILRLAQQFPGDPGAMAPFFLNYLLIAPGESFYMDANEPHAYVAGEIIEVMACSDNVVRAGLTAKFKDVSNLVNMLTYTMGGQWASGWVA